jgi:Rrf2 family protein
MHVNSRFAVAVHALLEASGAGRQASEDGSQALEIPDACRLTPDACVTSERIASIVHTHPVVVRRVLGALREAGLVTSQPGPGGGWKLTRDASTITLCDVYRAVEGESTFPHRAPSEQCPFGERLPAVLEACFREAEAAMERQLAQVTIADVLDAVRGGCLCQETGDQQVSATVVLTPASISQ